MRAFFIPLLISVLIAFAFYLAIRNPRNTPKPNFEKKYDSLKLELEQTQLERSTYRDSINNLNRRYEVLDSIVKVKDMELKAIRGRYKTHTPSELEIEMEKRAKQ